MLVCCRASGVVNGFCQLGLLDTLAIFKIDRKTDGRMDGHGTICDI